MSSVITARTYCCHSTYRLTRASNRWILGSRPSLRTSELTCGFSASSRQGVVSRLGDLVDLVKFPLATAFVFTQQLPDHIRHTLRTT
jgi:hypothetical protein